MRGRGFVASSHGGKTKKKKKDEKKKVCIDELRRGEETRRRRRREGVVRAPAPPYENLVLLRRGHLVGVNRRWRRWEVHVRTSAKSMSLLPMFSEGPRILCVVQRHVATHFSAAPPVTRCGEDGEGEAKQWAGARAAVRDSSVISHAADRGA